MKNLVIFIFFSRDHKSSSKSHHKSSHSHGSSSKDHHKDRHGDKRKHGSSSSSSKHHHKSAKKSRRWILESYQAVFFLVLKKIVNLFLTMPPTSDIYTYVSILIKNNWLDWNHCHMFTEMLLYFGNNWYIDNDSYFIWLIVKTWDWNVEIVSLEKNGLECIKKYCRKYTIRCYVFVNITVFFMFFFLQASSTRIIFTLQFCQPWFFRHTGFRKTKETRW